MLQLLGLECKWLLPFLALERLDMLQELEEALQLALVEACLMGIQEVQAAHLVLALEQEELV